MTDVTATLEELRRAGLLRRLVTVQGSGAGRAQIDGREVILLCSNDYLGLREHPQVREAAGEAALRWGAGAGASRLVAGNLELHEQLEWELRDFKRTAACVLFGSGYLANTGVIAALAGSGDLILSDSLNHASIVDGCRLSKAETIVYPHADLDALAWGLGRAGGRSSLIVTDAVFSMDGDLAPLTGIIELARRHHARVLVDEAHATGVVGPGGRGLVAELGLEGEVDVTIGTLSKALGSYGAFACCSRPAAEFLVNRARTLIFSTALPPASVAAGLAALRLVREQPELVGQLRSNAQIMRRALVSSGLLEGEAPANEPTPASGVPIFPLIVGDPDQAVQRSQAALSGGVFVQAIRPPTVPDGTSRLRVTVSAAHEEADLLRAATVLASVAVVDGGGAAGVI
jgi:glycine C-acetyltransferase/8-amino-7-oxononanoate synthase